MIQKYTEIHRFIFRLRYVVGREINKICVFLCGREINKICVFLCASVFFFSQAHAQEPFRVMHYNVENLFDCRHDSLKHDEEFLPQAVRAWTWAVRAWTWKKYYDKVTKIAKVILAASDGQVPDLVGLCEVENTYCLDGLTKYSPLRDAAYRYVMTDSPRHVPVTRCATYPHPFRAHSA